MMEITPHLKNVLKNYQHSATKSLQGPGLSLIPAKIETGPDIKDDLDYVQPQPFPIQQSPILTSADKTSSERLDTILEGEPISCFVVGGEKRLCLPQVLNYVLRDFNVDDINLECDNLQIYCSLCTDEQVIVLKNQGIIPSSAHSCGLITKTDAERLCSALLHEKKPVKLTPRKDALRFKIYHECFGKCRGYCVPEMYTSKKARCIECVDCQGWFSPQQFVSHVHMNLENRTVHWGFESANWRSYLVISEDQHNYEQYKKHLDKMKEQYDGKTPFTHIHHIGDYTNHKRKMMHHEVLIKQEEIPLKKNKREEYIPLPLATLSPLYLQYVQNHFMQTPSTIQFQPFKHFPSSKETKLRQTIALNNRFSTPQTMQYPDRTAQTERVENSYQPNVALAPPTPKKHRYINITSAEQAVVQEVTSSVQKGPLTATTVIKIEKPDPDSHKNVMQKSPDSQNIIDSTVSVVQSTGNLTRYNSEIELSTDTDDTASEASEKQCTDVNKMEEVLKNVNNEVKDALLKLFKKMAKEREDTIQESREKDNKIRDLETKLANLEKRFNTPTPPIITQNGICDTHNHSTDVAGCEATPPPSGGRLNPPTPHSDQNRTPTQTPVLDNSNVGSEENDSSVINTNKGTEEPPPPQKSVITTLESEAIKLTTASPPE